MDCMLGQFAIAGYHVRECDNLITMDDCHFNGPCPGHTNNSADRLASVVLVMVEREGGHWPRITCLIQQALELLVINGSCLLLVQISKQCVQVNSQLKLLHKTPVMPLCIV